MGLSFIMLRRVFIDSTWVLPISRTRGMMLLSMYAGSSTTNFNSSSGVLGNFNSLN